MSRIRDAFRVYGLTAAAIGLSWLTNVHTDQHVVSRLDPEPGVVSYAETARGYGSNTTIWDGERPITVTIGSAGRLEHHNKIRAGEPERTRSWERVEALEDILGETPGFYAERCGVTDIRLVEKPTYRSRHVDGLYQWPSSIYLNVSSPTFERTTIHELAHACTANIPESDPLWEPFIATEGTLDPSKHEPDDIVAGFAKAYGGTNPREDFATIAEDVILSPEYADARSEHDTVYAEKVDAARTFYRELGHPAFQD